MTSPTSTSPIPPPPSTTTTTDAPKAKSKSKKSKALKLKRRGAKVDDEDDVSEGEVEQTNGDASDSATSESESDLGEDDDDEEDDEEEEEKERGKEVKGPEMERPAVIAPPPGHPSWSDDLPSASEGAGADLPTLDFASLTLAPTSLDSSALTSPPATTTPAAAAAATPAQTPAQSKKQLLVAKKIAQSAALKESDPVAWEKAEKERLEREKEKREKKKESRKKKKQEKKDTPSEEKQAEVVATADPAPKRPVVPSRPSKTAIAQGLVPTPSSSTSTSTSTSTPTATPAPAGPSPSPRPRRSEGGPPSASIERAREAYQQKISSDPSFIPRVGKFWSHDARLDPAEVRALNHHGNNGSGGGWRGRGRGRGRGGAQFGGFGGEGRLREEKPALESDDSDDEGDNWGRGEAKKVPRASLPPSATAWSHDGFDEVKDLPPARSRPAKGARQPVGQPGEINPRFAHLPFHPQHRFKAAVPKVAAPAPPETVAPVENEVAPVEGGIEEEAQADSAPEKIPVVVNLGPKKPPAASITTPSAAAASATATPPPLQPSAPASSVLYATHLPPPSVAEETPLPVPVNAVAPVAYPGPLPPAYYQLPPHLAPVPNQVAYLGRGGAGSPFYGAAPAQFYAPSPDAPFPSMPTPGATPPPIFPHSQSPTPTSFFQPVSTRQSKIEIKSPSGAPTSTTSPGTSHSPSLSKSVLSARGATFNPRGSSPAPQMYGMMQPSLQQQQQRQQPYDVSEGGMAYYGGYGDAVSTFADANGVVYYAQPQQAAYFNPYQQPQQQPQQHQHFAAAQRSQQPPYDPSIIAAGQAYHRPQIARNPSPHDGYYDERTMASSPNGRPPYQSQWLPPPASYGDPY